MKLFKTKKNTFINPDHVESITLQQTENKHSVICYTLSRKIEILFSTKEEAENELNRFIRFIEESK